jgi:tetratricopeptide (TPR) repeat protein
MSEQIIDQANSLLKQNNFAEAGKIYRQEWETNHNAYAASRYLYCLRKAGYPEAALIQGNKAYSQFSEHLYIKRELIWIYYDLVKQFAEKKNLREAEKFAAKLLTLEPESLPLELTFFLIIDLAKEQNKWQIVADWCGKVKPYKLSNENSLIDGKKVKSKRERWYFAYLKSLIELNDWQKVNSLALEAINNYPKEINFKRWYVIFLAEQGNIEKAISQLIDCKRVIKLSVKKSSFSHTNNSLR